MPTTTTLHVSHPTGQYPIAIGHALLGELPALAGLNGAPFVVVTDSNVGPLYAAQLPAALDVVTVPAGERHKTLTTVNTLYDRLLAAGLDRSGAIVALGGGVVGDMAGFVAATYMRGVRFVQAPTSLLAMVDASVGGKVGVDLPQGKNLVGAFKQPEAVIVDLATLATLPAEERAAGLAEVIKHGIIADPALFTQIMADPAAALADPGALVAAAIAVKRAIVQADPYEDGQRALLNLGHTFGHAIEQVSAYRILHGYGVAIGIVCAAHVAAALGHCDRQLPDQFEALLAAVALPTRIPADLPVPALLAAMGSDKKKQRGTLRFILPRAVGDCFITADVPPTLLATTLRRLQAAA